MRKGESERRKVMKEGFMALREQNYSILEIAEHYQLSTWTVYQALGEIASENGVSRESLLYVVKKPVREMNATSRKIEVVDALEIKQEFEKMLNQVDKITEKINTAILQFEEDIMYENAFN